MVYIYITSHNFDIQLSNQLQNNINLFFVFFEAESCVCYNQMVFISINMKYTNSEFELTSSSALPLTFFFVLKSSPFDVKGRLAGLSPEVTRGDGHAHDI